MLLSRQILLAAALLLCTTSFSPCVTASPVPEGNTPTTAHTVHWGYSGAEAPSKWGTLSEEYSTCKTGLNQSPVDLAALRVTRTKTGAPTYNWSVVSSTSVVHNGHTIQINVPAGQTLSWGGETYELQQFHMHTPSEHRVNWQGGDMELHLVSKSSSGKLLVSGIIFVLGNKQDAFLNALTQLPSKAGDTGPAISVDLPHLLSAVDNFREHYEYSGSLTTPPCTEGVQWIVAVAKPVIGRRLLNTLTAAMGSNARPLMVNARQ